jgi:transposase-like protein
VSEKRITRQYEVEFKLDAVRLVEEQGYSVPEAAQRLGIPKLKLSNWRRQHREGRLMPGYLRAQPTPEEAELRQLRAEIKRLAVPKRKYRHRKTPEVLLETTNLLAPKPEIVNANQVWYADITFIKTAEGWLYLAAVMDAYSKRIVGYAMSDTMKTDLVIQPLRIGTRQRRISKGLIHHSDKGSQCQRSAEACRTPPMPTGANSQPGGCALVSPAPEPAWTMPISKASLRRSKKNSSTRPPLLPVKRRDSLFLSLLKAGT